MISHIGVSWKAVGGLVRASLSQGRGYWGTCPQQKLASFSVRDPSSSSGYPAYSPAAQDQLENNPHVNSNLFQRFVRVGETGLFLEIAIDLTVVSVNLWVVRQSPRLLVRHGWRIITVDSNSLLLAYINMPIRADLRSKWMKLCADLPLPPSPFISTAWGKKVINKTI